MKLGDMIRHYDADCGNGIIIEDPRPGRMEELGYATAEDILILWSDGAIEWCDPQVLDVINENR